MTQETRFSRIVVTTDDDDFVIEAGASQPLAQAPAEPAAKFNPAPAVDPAPAAAPEPVADRLDEPVSEPAPVASAAPVIEETRSQRKSAPASARNSADAYETTLEDLDSVSMSGVQKAVIAIAVLVVVAFAVFQFLA